jgi:hypothetical protein
MNEFEKQIKVYQKWLKDEINKEVYGVYWYKYFLSQLELKVPLLEGKVKQE